MAGFMHLFSRKDELGPLPYQVVMTGLPRMKFTRCHMFYQSHHVVLPQGVTYLHFYTITIEVQNFTGATSFCAEHDNAEPLYSRLTKIINMFGVGFYIGD
jgi:hypothetical protein